MTPKDITRVLGFLRAGRGLAWIQRETGHSLHAIRKLRDTGKPPRKYGERDTEELLKSYGTTKEICVKHGCYKRCAACDAEKRNQSIGYVPPGLPLRGIYDDEHRKRVNEQKQLANEAEEKIAGTFNFTDVGYGANWHE